MPFLHQQRKRNSSQNSPGIWGLPSAPATPQLARCTFSENTHGLGGAVTPLMWTATLGKPARMAPAGKKKGPGPGRVCSRVCGNGWGENRCAIRCRMQQITSLPHGTHWRLFRERQRTPLLSFLQIWPLYSCIHYICMRVSDSRLLPGPTAYTSPAACLTAVDKHCSPIPPPVCRLKSLRSVICL